MRRLLGCLVASGAGVSLEHSGDPVGVIRSLAVRSRSVASANRGRSTSSSSMRTGSERTSTFAWAISGRWPPRRSGWSCSSSVRLASGRRASAALIALVYTKKPTRPIDVAAALEMSPTSGPFRGLCGAAIGYGLTEGGPNASEISLTSLGQRVVAPLEEGDDDVARRQAVLAPTVSKAFLERGGVADSAQVPDVVLVRTARRLVLGRAVWPWRGGGWLRAPGACARSSRPRWRRRAGRRRWRRRPCGR